MSVGPFIDTAAQARGGEPSDSWRWATVMTVSPLRIRFDGDGTTLAVTPDTLVGKVQSGDRVWAQLHGRRIVVIGRAGGDLGTGGGTGGAPSGPAGGDLTGNYPNPEIRAGAIVDADVNSAAAIQQSKIANLPADLAAKADDATTMTAGSGLTGGGTLGANRTFDVGAGTGISVSADAVALDTSYTDARYALKADTHEEEAFVGPGTPPVLQEIWIDTDEPDPQMDYSVPNLFFRHDQPILATTWIVDHGLGYHPHVHVEDAAGSEIHGSVQHLSDFALTVSFDVAITGSAHCS